VKRISILLLVVTICLNLAETAAQEATRWRGPSGNGVYPDKKLLQSWPAEGPEILWHFDELGPGYSSPVFARGNIYISGIIDETGYIFILSLDGKLINKYPYGPEYFESYPGSRSTPVIAGEQLYMLNGYGRLVCLHADKGTTIWAKELFKDFDGRNTEWGITETVVVDGDLLFCSPGGIIHNVVALDRHTGKLIWKCSGKGEFPAYNTPLLINLPERKLLVNMMASHTLGIDARTGELLWTQYQPNQWSVHANTPIYADGGVYCFSGYGQGGFKLELGNNGKIEKKSWTNKSLDSRIGGAVLVDGYIYGSGDQDRSWQCLNWETGEQTYSSVATGNGVVISADGLLFCYSQRGELVLAKAQPDQFKIAGKTTVDMGSGQHWAHPVINGGRLYLRHGNVLIAYKIAA